MHLYGPNSLKMWLTDKVCVRGFDFFRSRGRKQKLCIFNETAAMVEIEFWYEKLIVCISSCSNANDVSPPKMVIIWGFSIEITC